MEFTVPKFIDRKTKIVGPFNFAQIIVVGVAGAICLFLFFALPFSAFVIVAIVLLGGAFSLAFVKVKKVPLPVLIKNFFFYLFKPRVYLWKKKSMPSSIIKKEEEKKEKDEIEKKQPSLKVAEGSNLRNLSTYLETK